ncbi:hypothetical protein HU200_066478 [Digitaria exilis]|uniref:MIF4G domain-containing protein n=1 Tax=Digitaria exilis TaxID=1010633 RepID=A0A834ZY23_9POAL|nr:hypothetical protein HU200_066478 [Digitaria exilis]
MKLVRCLMRKRLNKRQLKAILNKLTPQNFEKLFAQVKELNIDNVVTLTGVISQIFDKALMEPTFCEMYASFCSRLAGDLPNFVKDDEKITFKRLLLNKCQEEFERGEREQAEADKAEEAGGTKQSDGEREEKRIRARRLMLGNIRLIGELYKMKMLTERIMHECINKLLGEYQNAPLVSLHHYKRVRWRVREESTASSVLQHGSKAGKGAASGVVVMAANRRKEAIVSAIKKRPAAILAQRTKAAESKKRAGLAAAQLKEATAAISPQETKVAKNKKKAGLVAARVKEATPAISLQKTKAMEKKKKKKKEAALAVLKGKAAVKVAPKAKQVIILSDDDDDVKEEDSSSDEEYGEEGDSVDKNSDDVKEGEDSSSDEDYDEEGDIMDKDDSDDDSEYEEEEELVALAQQPTPVMADEVAEEKVAVHQQQPRQVEEPAVVEEADDGDERAIVRVKKFEGSTILAEVDRTEDNGVASRTGRRKVRKLQKSQLVHGKEDYAKGTF